MSKDLTVDQTMRELQLEREELEILIKEKKIDFFIDKGTILFPLESIEKYKKEVMESSTLRIKGEEIQVFEEVDQV